MVGLGIHRAQGGAEVRRPIILVVSINFEEFCAPAVEGLADGDAVPTGKVSEGLLAEHVGISICVNQRVFPKGLQGLVGAALGDAPQQAGELVGCRQGPIREDIEGILLRPGQPHGQRRGELLLGVRHRGRCIGIVEPFGDREIRYTGGCARRPDHSFHRLHNVHEAGVRNNRGQLLSKVENATPLPDPGRGAAAQDSGFSGNEGIMVPASHEAEGAAAAWSEWVRTSVAFGES